MSYAQTELMLFHLWMKDHTRAEGKKKKKKHNNQKPKTSQQKTLSQLSTEL